MAVWVVFVVVVVVVIMVMLIDCFMGFISALARSVAVMVLILAGRTNGRSPVQPARNDPDTLVDRRSDL